MKTEKEKNMNNPLDENEVVTATAEPTAAEPAVTETATVRPNVAKPTARKKTWAIVLAAVVSFLVVLAIALVILFALGDNSTEPIEEPESIGSVNSDFFVADVEYDKSLYTNEGAYELEGELLDYYGALSLGCVKVLDVDNYNHNIETVKMVDLVTGKVYLEKSIGNPRGEIPTVGIDAEFCDECGIFAIAVEYYDDIETADIDESRTEIYHYTSKENPELLGLTDSRGHECRDLGDVYAIHIDKKISFFDVEMNLLSDYNGDFLSVDDIPYLSADSYMVSEKEGYFYFFNNYEVLVYNLKGDCMAKYTDEQTTAGYIGASVLNNGRVFIQRLRILDSTIAKKYDFRVGTLLFDVESMIMDNITGEITALDCNFIAFNFSPRYARDPRADGFPLLLKEGYDNQAYISYFKDGVISEESEYVVLDNSLKVQYTFPRGGRNVDFEESVVIDDSRFIAKVDLGQENQYYLFDISGKFISAVPITGTEFTDSFIVSNKVIYNHEMKEIYNFAKNGFISLGVTGDTVYLKRYSEATKVDEIYSFNSTATEPTLVANGIEIIDYTEIVDDYCVILDERGWKTVYNYSGEIIAATDGDLELVPVEDALMMKTVIDGEIRHYILPQVEQ